MQVNAFETNAMLSNRWNPASEKMTHGKCEQKEIEVIFWNPANAQQSEASETCIMHNSYQTGVFFRNNTSVHILR